LKSGSLTAKTQPVSIKTLNAKQTISSKTLQPVSTKARVLGAKKSQPPGTKTQALYGKTQAVRAKVQPLSIKTQSATTKTRGKIAEPVLDLFDDDFPRSGLSSIYKNIPLGTLVPRAHLVSPATIRPIKINPVQSLEHDQSSCLPSCRQYCTMQCPTQCCSLTLRNKALKITPFINTRAQPILQKSQILQKQHVLQNSRVYSNPLVIPRWAFQNPNPFKLWSNETLKASDY